MDNLWAFLGLGVLTLANLVSTWIDRRRGKDRADAREKVLTGVADKVDAVNDQIVNDHGEHNLREQLDRMEQLQKDTAADVRGMKRDIGRLADAAVDDRETHRTDIARVDGEIKELKRRQS